MKKSFKLNSYVNVPFEFRAKKSSRIPSLMQLEPNLQIWTNASKVVLFVRKYNFDSRSKLLDWREFVALIPTQNRSEKVIFIFQNKFN